MFDGICFWLLFIELHILQIICTLNTLDILNYLLN